MFLFTNMDGPTGILVKPSVVMEIVTTKDLQIGLGVLGYITAIVSGVITQVD